jgi:eukaryotic-like serine/threonine-protein kinase
LKLRGLGWKPKEVGALAPLDAARIDACWTVASGLGMIDPIRGADFQTRNLLLSLEAGDPARVARSLAMEAMYQSTSGRKGRDRAAAILGDAAALAERLGDPKLRGLCTFAAGMAAYEGGEWSRARDLLQQADTIFLDACAGVTLEVTTNRHFLVLALLQLGEIQDLARRVPDYILDAEDRGDRFAATSFRNGCMNIAWLVDDDVRGARAAVGRAMTPWAAKPFYLQHYEGLYAQVTIDLYAGDGPAAWRRIEELWPELKSSLLLQVQQLRLEALFFRGRSALAAAAVGGEGLPTLDRLLKEAEQAARRIESEGMDWSRPLATVLRSGVAARRGRGDEAVHSLGDAVAQLELQDMRLYAAAARYQRGRAIGGRDGDAAIEQALVWFEGQGVRNPAAMAGLFAPVVRVD